jgi:hypothetical protein
VFYFYCRGRNVKCILFVIILELLCLCFFSPCIPLPIPKTPIGPNTSIAITRCKVDGTKIWTGSHKLVFNRKKSGFSEYSSLYSSSYMKILSDSVDLLCSTWQQCCNYPYNWESVQNIDSCLLSIRTAPPCRVKIAQKGNIKSNKIEMNLMHFIKW